MKKTQILCKQANLSQNKEEKYNQTQRYLQLGQTLDGFQRPQHSEHTQRLDSTDVFPLAASSVDEHKHKQQS